ncbi:MAG: transporter substrate-binding domain-containing protein, partial [Deltaproteobacteria bacterium]|nr:transporter substrate-binding domain-containing protein [Deltaproteobacteria bacterium]
MVLLTAMPGYCRTLSEILDQGTLRVGMIAQKDYPFVFESKTGKMVGFDVLLSHDIARELGVRADIHRTV